MFQSGAQGPVGVQRQVGAAGARGPAGAGGATGARGPAGAGGATGSTVPEGSGAQGKRRCQIGYGTSLLLKTTHQISLFRIS